MPKKRNISEINEAKWQEQYKRLLRFVKREGNCRVPARYVEDDVRLGRWVSKQRELRDQLSKDRYQLLEKIPGWFWKGQDAKWARASALIEQYAKREGHTRVPKKHIEDGFALGVWVMHLRDDYLRGHLSEERRKYLQKLPGWVWDATGKRDQKPRKAPKPPKTNDLANVELDELAENAWGILYEYGTLTEKTALYKCADGLYEAGLIRSRHARDGSPLANLLSEVLKHARKLGYIDQPEKGFIRALLPDPTEYETEDWLRCLLSVMNGDDLSKDEVISQTAEWASENLGLEYKNLRKDGVIWKGINSAINKAVRTGELERVGRNVLRRSH